MSDILCRRSGSSEVSASWRREQGGTLACRANFSHALEVSSSGTTYLVYSEAGVNSRSASRETDIDQRGNMTTPFTTGWCEQNELGGISDRIVKTSITLPLAISFPGLPADGSSTDMLVCMPTCVAALFPVQQHGTCKASSSMTPWHQDWGRIYIL
ncbi:hypothetical protein TEQG_01780 [Trichophyton equinum CBS 127.97]|uniref:Uncharacterized protein n=1 Tax=Trichophyton equinum (strain ATCC MYA-4606 / CBS 127.97) TaxID=559882 RepID=F2PLE5_TRIEC|nr:hypothetical protein TEQG_01780 [Trichophyton equinum CBS 127.97]